MLAATSWLRRRYLLPETSTLPLHLDFVFAFPCQVKLGTLIDHAPILTLARAKLNLVSSLKGLVPRYLQASLQLTQQLLGMLRAASGLEPELTYSALSLLATLSWTDQGQQYMKQPLPLLCMLHTAVCLNAFFKGLTVNGPWELPSAC